MKKLILLLITISSLLFSQGNRETDSLALVQFYSDMVENSLGWNFSDPLNTWSGVSLDSINGRSTSKTHAVD